MEKNFQSEEAIKKLQTLTGEISTCFFLTAGKTAAHDSRPMMVVDTDGGGNIWFFAHARSNKVKDIAIDHHVQLIFAHPGKSCYLDVRGRAGVVYDKQSVKDKWTPLVKTWFPQGTDDPDLCLLKIKTDEAHYWTGENGGITEIFRIFTGKQPVAHGELHI